MTQKRFNKLRMTLFAQMYADAKKGYETGEVTLKALKGMARTITWKNIPVAVTEKGETYQMCWEAFRKVLSHDRYPVLNIEK